MFENPDMKILKTDTIISDSNLFIRELEKYISYAFYKEGKQLFIEDSVKEMRNHILNFLILIAESHSSIAEDEINYIKDIFKIENPKNLFKTTNIAILQHKRELFSHIPVYLRELRNLRNGHEATSFVIDCLIKIGINFAASDAAYSETEAKLIAEYYQLLKKELIGFYYLNENSTKKIKEAGSKFEKTQKPSSSNVKARDLDAVLSEFNELIGLHDVKYELNTLINLAKINKIRKSRNLPIVQTSMHLVFCGNPGTGKTTIARLLSEIYGCLGLLSNGSLIEVTRSDLVGEFVGQTAQKTKNVLEKAKGNILFIDEAYSLTQGGKDDYGKEAVAELLKGMEDNRTDLVVIAAGYKDEMNKFINMNPGLKSRFNKYIEFDDYTPEELLDILELMLAKNKYRITYALSLKILDYFKTINKDTFANARGVRNLFEKMLEHQANRIVNLSNVRDIDLLSLTDEDFYEASKALDSAQKLFE